MSATKHGFNPFRKNAKQKPYFQARIEETEQAEVYSCCLEGEGCTLRMIQSLKEEVDALYLNLSSKQAKKGVDPDRN